MTVKQFFRSLYYAQISIEKKREKIEELKALAESSGNGAIRYDKLRVMTSTPQSGGFEDKVIEIVDLKKKLQEDIDDLTERLDIGRKMINSLDSQEERLVMEMHYINHMTFKQVARRMHYSEETIYYKHRSAIRKLNKMNSLQVFTV